MYTIAWNSIDKLQGIPNEMPFFQECMATSIHHLNPSLTRGNVDLIVLNIMLFVCKFNFLTFQEI